VNPADIAAFARREWHLVEDLKAKYWAERKRTLLPADALQLGDELRRYVLRVRPGWPGTADREDDLNTHVRVAEALGAVSRRPR
jgi:hypothetical protein